MVANLWVKIEIDSEERKRIQDAIDTLNEVADCYSKASSEAGWVANNLRDGVSALKGVLDGEYI